MKQIRHVARQPLQLELITFGDNPQDAPDDYFDAGGVAVNPENLDPEVASFIENADIGIQPALYAAAQNGPLTIGSLMEIQERGY